MSRAGDGRAGSAMFDSQICVLLLAASVRPSGLNATELTMPGGPTVNTPDGSCHNRTVSSSLPVAQGPVRPERHRVDGLRIAGQGLAERNRLGRVGRIPQPDGIAAVADGQGQAVRAEGHRVDRPDRVGQGLPEQGRAVRAGNVPQPDLVIAADSQGTPVWAVCYCAGEGGPGQGRSERDRPGRVGHVP